MLHCLLGDGEGVEVSVNTGSSEEDGGEEVTTLDDVTATSSSSLITTVATLLLPTDTPSGRLVNEQVKFSVGSFTKSSVMIKSILLVVCPDRQVTTDVGSK